MRGGEDMGDMQKMQLQAAFAIFMTLKKTLQEYVIPTPITRGKNTIPCPNLQTTAKLSL